MEQSQAMTKMQAREIRAPLRSIPIDNFPVLIGLVLFGLVTVFPFYFLLTTSIKAPEETWRIPITWIPQSFSLEHYIIAIGFGFPRVLLNGLVYAGVGTFLAVYVSALIGFVIVKFPSKMGDFLFWVILSSTLMPLATYVVTLVGLLAKITQVTGIPMLNTYWGLILPRIVYAFGVFLMRQAMLTMPDELLDSAKVDGASTWRQFWQITLPIVKPHTTTLAILIFMGLYGEFLWPLVATSSNEMQVLSVWLAGRTAGYGVNPGLTAASATLVIIPMAILYLFGQRYIVEGIGLQGFK